MSSGSANFELPSIPAFLTKLRLLVDNEETNDLIYWHPDGLSFHIVDGNRLAKEILPLFFKHNNFSSFIRQLNMYGFRKINRAESSLLGSKSDVEYMQFHHPFFVRQKPQLLSNIQRKPPSYANPGAVGGRISNDLSSRLAYVPTTLETASLRPRPATVSDLIRLSSIIRTMRVTQENMANRMSILQSQNELLFRELNDLRERHEHQSQLIQTLFDFLSAFAKDTRAQGFHFGLKRRALALALPDNVQSHSGLRLNLPRGFRLDDSSVEQLKRVSSNSLSEVPYKLTRRDPQEHPSSIPNNQLVAVNQTHPDAQFLRNSLWDEQGGGAQPLQAITLGPVTAHDALSGAEITTSDTSRLAMNQHQESDLPLSSLTTASQLRAKNHELLNNGVSELGHSEGKLSHHLMNPDQSRCTTPLSLVQPDSLDIYELLGTKRQDDESEISIDDLFLTSGALDEFQSDQDRLDRFGKSSSLTTPVNDRSGSFDATDPGLFDESTATITTATSSADLCTPTRTTGITPVADLAKRLQFSPVNPDDSLQELGCENLFGLPWDDNDDGDSIETAGLDATLALDENPTDHFNTASEMEVSGTAPPSQTSTATHLDAVANQHATTGSTVAHTESPAAPITTVVPTSFVRILEPTTLIPVRPLSTSLVHVSSQGDSPPVLVTRPRLWVPTTLHSLKTYTIPSQSPSGSTGVQNPVAKPNSVQKVKHGTPNTRRKESITFRPIAPAPVNRRTENSSKKPPKSN